MTHRRRSRLRRAVHVLLCINAALWVVGVVVLTTEPASITAEADA